MKKFFAVASAALLALSIPLQANANDFSTSGWQTGFTVTTTSEGLDGSGNYVITATWDHTSALFTTSDSFDPGTLKANGYRVLQCDTVPTYTFDVVTTPSDCSFIMNGAPSSSTATISGDGEVLTVVHTISAADFAAQTREFLVPDVWFKDVIGNDLIVPSGGSSVGPSSGDSDTPAQTPSYTGPKISSFNLGSVAPGGSLVASGKKLDQIQSATIGGKAASLSYSSSGLTIGVPEDLTPGTYDLVMQTSHGVLTHINAVVVRAKPELSVITIRGTGNSISEDLATELAAISELHSAGYNKIHCVVNMADATAAEAIAAAACDLLKLGSLADATTLTTLKSSFKGSGFWLRIYIAG